MTNKEYREKYPIGTEIIYRPNANIVHFTARKDIGKQGTVIGYYRDNQVKILLPTSKKPSKTWTTSWENIKLLPQKNQQLQFSFMEMG